ncbi:hypothetical protein [Clostridium paraputrificum]|uniref:hypothetical protein n=1 Tax=Clostridium paraputrificum TaxID=29363 RepID=UPI0006C02C21|nr:hypothetical protein [Clostridium paraputrificum]CUO20434.1 Uncharacterised protein [Clostridium paraputrificum]
MKRRLSVILILLTFSLIAISCGNMVKTSSGEKDSEIEKSNDIVMSIKEQREKDLTLSIENIKLDTYFGELKKGKYRIVKEFYKDEEKKKVFVEFSL